VVSTPLKKISQLGLLFPIYGKIKNDPNHQPVIVEMFVDIGSFPACLLVPPFYWSNPGFLFVASPNPQKNIGFLSENDDLWCFFGGSPIKNV